MMFAGIGFDARSQATHELVALNNKVIELSNAGKYGEAIDIATKSIAVAETQFGPEHHFVATCLGNLAGLYVVQARYAEAEPLYRRSLVIREKALGVRHPSVGKSLNHLGVVERARGRIREAEFLFLRAGSIFETVADPLNAARSFNSLAELYREEGRYSEAEPLHKRALEIREASGEQIDIGESHNNLALLYLGQGRYAEAELLLRRSVAIFEAGPGDAQRLLARSLNNLAELYRVQGRYVQAEPIYKRALSIREAVLRPDHPDVGETLNGWAALCEAQGRYSEAEPLHKRTASIWEKALGADSVHVGTSLNNLAELYRVLGRYREAEPLYRRSISIFQKVLGPKHVSVGTTLNNLALLYFFQGEYDQAEDLHLRALTITEAALGANHPVVGNRLNNLASLYRAQGRYNEAETLFRRSLAIGERELGPDHPDVGRRLSGMALLYLAQRNWQGAAEYWLRSTDILVKHGKIKPEGIGPVLAGTRGRSETEQSSWQFRGLVVATYRLGGGDLTAVESRVRESFQAAQWALSSRAAVSLAQMGARGAARDPALAILVRERQDLVGEWQSKDKTLLASKSETPNSRNIAAEKELDSRLAAIDRRLVQIDTLFAENFPEFSALVSPDPLTLSEVQSKLRNDEVLVLFLDTDDRFNPLPEETFVWVVTKTESRWVRSALGTKSLERGVSALRCGLDNSAWAGDGLARCNTVLGLDAKTPRPRTLPFDPARAHALYRDLFGEVEDLIRDKHLLVVPSGPLQQLPFHVLVTSPPANGASTAWLARQYAVTVLPSVASLKALRNHARPSAARRPYVAFANPLLDGAGEADKARAALAAYKRDCAAVAQVSEIKAIRETFEALVVDAPTLGGVANVSVLRRLKPVPQTADLACDVAKSVGAAENDIHLGARATEANVKAMSASGVLASYAVVNFATHGAIAGELTTRAEPGLVLTPPETGMEEDDGYLSASEVAGLKLDADWVILSACNTAAGGAADAEALSGLARAFFYSGARAMLVSHWPVLEEAAVALVTKALATMAADKTLGRAEAMRRAMIALADSSDPAIAHPGYWAPFVVVGEGAGLVR